MHVTPYQNFGGAAVHSVPPVSPILAQTTRGGGGKREDYSSFVTLPQRALRENGQNDYVAAPRTIGSRHRVPTQGEPGAIFSYRSATFVKVRLGAPSLVKPVNCQASVISGMGSSQATRRWQGRRPVDRP